MDIFEVVLIGEDTFIDDLHCGWSAIADESAEKD